MKYSIQSCQNQLYFFFDPLGVFIHASQVHYANELQNAYWPEIELTNSCPLCNKSIDKTKYLAHVGGKHKKITMFMTNEKREAYLNIERQKLTIGRKRKKMLAGNFSTNEYLIFI